MVRKTFGIIYLVTAFNVYKISGGGGVGKSFLINCVSMWAEKILRKAGDHPLKPKVLLLAQTGIAASLIGNMKPYANIYKSLSSFI